MKNKNPTFKIEFRSETSHASISEFFEKVTDMHPEIILIEEIPAKSNYNCDLSKETVYSAIIGYCDGYICRRSLIMVLFADSFQRSLDPNSPVFNFDETVRRLNRFVDNVKSLENDEVDKGDVACKR